MLKNGGRFGENRLFERRRDFIDEIATSVAVVLVSRIAQM